MNKRIALFALGSTIMLSAVLFAWSTATMSAQNQPAPPIAYGWVNFDGSLQSGTGNLQAFFDTQNLQYEIAIDGIDYFFNEYVTVVSPALGFSDRNITASITSVSGNLVVVLLDPAGERTQQDFQFVTFRP